MNYNDYELLYIINENEEAAEILYDKYKGLITKIVNKIYNMNPNIGIEKNDLMLEGMYGLDKAIKNFESEYNNKFITYAYKCIVSNIISYIKTNTKLKSKPLNDSISFDYIENDKETHIYNPFINAYKYIEEKEFNIYFINHLKGIEKEIIIYKMLGFSNIEISKILNISNKSINNAIYRIKNKLKKN